MGLHRFGRSTLAGLVALVAAPVPGQEPYRPPLGLHDMDITVPEDNPITAGRVALGEQLFFDTRLSRNGNMSCETCHVPEKGWTDGLRLSPRWDGTVNTRHTPTLYGVAYYPELYWDGRAAAGLESQITAAWKGHMGGEPEKVAAALNGIPGYAKQFQAAFGGPATGERIAMALATFVRTIHAGDTPWDRMTPQQRMAPDDPAAQGFKVFSQVAKCTLCHLPPLFSDTLYHNVGVGMDAASPDLGRGGHLRQQAEKDGSPVPPEARTLAGAFKTPSLRGVALSGPYFHDGSAATLEEAVDLMLEGGKDNPHKDPALRAWPYTEQQRDQLLAFLRALTPDAKYERPKLP